MENAKLALLGGEKSVSRSLADVSAKVVPQKAYKTIETMLDNGQISEAPIVKEFEKKFASYIGADYGLCVVNGTTSIQAGLFAVGVQPGDEVIVPSFTFWATVGPVVANGAIPVFADVDEDTHNLSAASVEKLVTEKTKAILLVHVWGNPCDMDAIMAVAKKHNLKVVEDCSHAHGATYKGKKVGSIGDVGCFSMQGSKVLAAGEGGILVTSKKEYYDRAVALGHYERCRLLGEDSPYAQYSLTGYGYKHRINPLAAAVADANLDRLDEMNAIRSKNARRFEELLADIPFIKFQKEPEGADKVFAYHYAQYVPESFGGVKLGTLLYALAKEGVSCGSCGYGRLHYAPLYNKEGPFGQEFPFNLKGYPNGNVRKLPNTERLGQTVFMAAPRFETATEADLQEYAAAYHKVAANMEALLAYEKEQAEATTIANNGRSINYVKV
ncbi:MAG: DegT/DnrJ/EryC1/StrS family aminotransferase [Clostridia bacterium]|nr:DegT/DnrJ/EryC1/StrS family aminotransferase [Clostridia bacterium]